MKIPGPLACLLAYLVVAGVRCSLAKPADTPEEEWLQWVDWSDTMLDEAMPSSMAPVTEAGHHASRAQSQHPTGILTSLPDQPPQAGSQSTDTARGRGDTPWESLEAIEDFLMDQPNEGTILSEYYNASPSSGASHIVLDSLQHTLDSSPTSPALASLHCASPSMITATTTTTTTTNQNERKSPPRSEVPFGSPELLITQLSAGPRLDLIPVHSDIQSDHCQPYFDSTSEPPSQGRPRKRKERPQRALDEPTHPVLGSIQGSKILPAEPPETLPPQAPFTFDVSLFQFAGTADIPADEYHLQQKQFDGIRKVIEACPSKLLVIPEEKFLEYSKFYYSYLHKQASPPNRQEGLDINHAKTAGTPMTRDANRKLRMNAKLEEFNGNVDFWYDWWFANTGIHFKINHKLAHYKFISPHRRFTIHSLYLFYVEMISSIVPRTSQSETLASELKLAQEAYESLSKAANKQGASRGNEQSINNAAVEGSVGAGADKLLNKAAEKLKDQSTSRIIYKSFTPLWTYLEFWMDTNRRGIFKKPSEVDSELPKTSKAFFNAVFLQSYTALYNRCLLYQNKSNPGFM